MVIIIRSTSTLLGTDALERRDCMSVLSDKRTLAWISLEFINGKRKPQVGRPIGCRFTVAVVSTSKRVTQRRHQFG